MSSSFQLHGPPELRHGPPPAIETPPEKPEMEMEMEKDSDAERYCTRGGPPMGFTENNSLTYLATGNPCVDLFFHVVPYSPSPDVIKWIEAAWEYDQVTTLKLICNIRGVRGTGKSDKENFYTAALWLHQHHPDTLAANVAVFAEFGYFKDLLEILFRILEGPDVRIKAGQKQAKANQERRRTGKGRSIRCFPHQQNPTRKVGNSSHANKLKAVKKILLIKQLRNSISREDRVKDNMMKVNEEKNKARVLRKEKELAKARRVLDRFKTDSNFQFLHNQISTLFAEVLKSDLEILKSDEKKTISLAAKWCPKIDSAYDKATLIYESIAKKVFPREDYPEYEGIEEAHYAYRVRDRLRKEVLVPLRQALQLPEVYMSAKKWNSLPYNRVASVAMKNYKEFFLIHDEDRFKQYLEDVKEGKAKIAAGALLPHEIIKSLNDGDEGKVAELQWARMVDDVAKLGKLSNCIAVCDVSGSMSGIPMEVSVALGLLISELSEEPWKGNVITFSQNPELHKIEGDSLLEKTSFIRRMEAGMNTDFQKVFDRILEVAINGNLTEDQMIKRIFVFSDMEFDVAVNPYVYDYHYNNNPEDSDPENDSKSEDGDPGRLKAEEARKKGWETDYEVIQRKFQNKGFNNVPEIVFWNLRHSSATPVTVHQNGVAMVSGFSKNLVTVFLEEGGLESFNPLTVMEKAIEGELYQKLVVVD